MLLLFSRLNMGSSTVVNSLASCTFGVYLLHDAPIARGLVWDALLRVPQLYLGPWFPLAAPACIAAVFAICAGVDVLRQRFIAPRIDTLAESFARWALS